MAKYILNIPDEILEFMNGEFNFFIEPEVKVGECKHYKVRLDDTEIVPYTELDRESIENEVWNFVSKFVWSVGDQEILGMGITHAVRDMTYQEARDKYKLWQSAREPICIGDEVEQITASGNPVGLKFVVTKIVDGEILKGVSQTGEVITQIKRWWRKTGRHFNSVEKLLEEMRD